MCVCVCVCVCVRVERVFKLGSMYCTMDIFNSCVTDSTTMPQLNIKG